MDPLLKEVYSKDAVEDLVYDKNPLLGLIKKNQNMTGAYEVVPTIYGNPQARSASFSRAVTRSTSTNTASKSFLVTRVTDYSLASISNHVILASKNDEGAFLRALTLEIDGAIKSLTNSIATAVYGTGYGAIGQIGSISTTTITLLDLNNIVNFEVGMELMLSSAESTATLRALGTSGNGLIITSIDRIAGTITFAANVTDATSGIPTAAANDYIFVRGDREDSATPARLRISGLPAWCVYGGVAGSGDSFFGVDRAADKTRLGGLYYDGSAVPIEEALIEGAMLAGREGGMIDHYFMSFPKYSALEKALGSKVQYVDLKANANIAFRGIRVNGPSGEINVIPDRSCPNNRCFGLTLSTWTLGSIGPMVRVIDADGLEILRQATLDGFEYRSAFYGNLYCNAPGWNININLGS